MADETNQERTQRLFEELFNQGNMDSVGELIAPDYVDHSPIPAPAPGPEGFGQRTQMLRAAFVEQVTFGEFLAEGDLVAFTWTLSGIHKGVFAGAPPSNKHVTLPGINVERFRGGKIVEHWSHFDAVGLLRQMGALPPPQKPSS